MTVSAQERLHAFRARSQQYLRLGHDRLAAARFVADSAGEPPGPVLDIGTGKGLLAIAFARRGLEVVTIDVDESERELVKLLAAEAGVREHLTLETGDAAHLPYVDGRFGCVAMMDVMHHLTEPSAVLHEMARVVAPRGIVVVADFDEDGFELVSRVHRSEGREHPRTSATVASALEELTRLGFEHIGSARGHQHEVEVLAKPESY